MDQALRTNENDEEQGSSRRDLATWCVWILAALLLASGITLRVSIMTSSVRILLAATFLFSILTLLVFAGKLISAYPRLLFPGLFILGLAVLWATLYNVPPNVRLLREAYYRRLAAFEGAPYVPGGETITGADCSGIARAALWEAMLKQGITQTNPRLLGPEFAKFWWRDLSARDIGAGKYGYTRVIGYAPKLAGYDTSKLHIGDMAIAHGIHLLVYYGDGRWIEANPDDKKVVINRAPANSRRGWFNTQVTLVRWRILDEPKRKEPLKRLHPAGISANMAMCKPSPLSPNMIRSRVGPAR